MAKKLLSKDYYQIVIDALLLPEKDVNKYYYNIVDEWHNDNPDLFTELKEVLNEWIEWYKGQARGGTVPVEMPDGTIKYFDRNQIFSSDGSGDYTKWIKHDLYEHKIFLLPLTSIRNVKVNKAYFENHLKTIELIDREKKNEIISNFLERVTSNLENIKQSRAVLIPQLQTTLTGFQSSLTDIHIENLYIKMNGNYIETITDHFIAIFKNEPLPPNCKIKWIDKSITRHEPNKQTLFEFFFLLKDHGYLDKSNFDTNPTNKNNLYRKLETIFPELMNFQESNPTASQRKTPRQKELEKIILSLKS